MYNFLIRMVCQFGNANASTVDHCIQTTKLLPGHLQSIFNIILLSHLLNGNDSYRSTNENLSGPRNVRHFQKYFSHTHVSRTENSAFPQGTSRLLAIRDWQITDYNLGSLFDEPLSCATTQS